MTKSVERWMRDFSGWANPLLLLAIAWIAGFPFENKWTPVVFLALNELVCTLIKLIYFKPRPNKKPYSNWIEKIENGGFPSIHSARGAYMGWIIIGSLQYLMPITFAILLATGFWLAIATSRIMLQKHDIWDVLAGTAIGGLIGFYVFWQLPILQQLF